MLEMILDIVIEAKRAQLKVIEAKYPVVNPDVMSEEDFDLMFKLDQQLDMLYNAYPDTDFQFERNLDLSGAIEIAKASMGNGSIESLRFVTHMFKNGHIITLNHSIHGLSHVNHMDFWGW